MVASFSIVPVGVGEELRDHIARILKVIDESGLPYRIGAMQTTVEGNTDEVMALILKCHAIALENANRVLTHIAIDDRKGAAGRLAARSRTSRKY